MCHAVNNDIALMFNVNGGIILLRDGVEDNMWDDVAYDSNFFDCNDTFILGNGIRNGTWNGEFPKIMINKNETTTLFKLNGTGIHLSVPECIDAERLFIYDNINMDGYSDYEGICILKN